MVMGQKTEGSGRMDGGRHRLGDWLVKGEVWIGVVCGVLVLLMVSGMWLIYTDRGVVIEHVDGVKEDIVVLDERVNKKVDVLDAKLEDLRIEVVGQHDLLIELVEVADEMIMRLTEMDRRYGQYEEEGWLKSSIVEGRKDSSVVRLKGLPGVRLKGE